MSLNTALAAPQTALLATPQYAGEVLVSLFSNRVVFAGQITSDLSTGNWAQFNYGSVSVGAYTDVREFQCLLIGSVNDISKATFYGRVRKVPTSSIMYSNESSQNFSVGAYWWILDSWLPQYRLSRPSTNDPLTAVELVDDDIPYQPILPGVVGLRTGYAGYVDPLTGYLRLGFDLSQSYAGESGATIASYVYAFPNATVVAGATNQAIVIVDIPYGEQWGGASVTDSAGRVQARRFAIKVHDPDSYPPDTGFGDGTIENHLEQGLTFSIPAFTGVDNVLKNTCCIVWRNNLNEMYDGTVQSLYGGGSAAVTNKVLTSQTATLTATAHPFAVGQTVINADCGAGFDGTFIITATTSNTYSFHSAHANVASTPVSGMGVVNPNNVMFVGWLQSEDDPVRSDPTHTVVATTNFKFTGVGPRMARRARQLLALINTASPSRWGDINNLTPWRAILHYLQRYTTVATLCDITFSQTDSQYLFPAISTDGQNMLDVVKGIATQINALPAFAPDGRIAIDRDITYLSTAERTAQVTNVADWTSADVLTGITLSRDPDPDIGYTDAIGSFYNTATSQIVTLTSRAPGIALGDAPGSNTMPAQILSAGVDVLATIDELTGRAGGLFKYTNLKEFIEADHPDGYSAVPFIPSRSQTFTWTISSSEWGPNNVNRYDYDTSVLWVVDSASYAFRRELGRITNRIKYRHVVPTGDPGDNTTKNVPAPDSIPDVNPDLGFPAFNFDLPEIYFPDIGLALADVNPAFLTNPPGKVATFNGSELLVWNTSQIFYEKNFIALTHPIPVDITPSNLPSGYSVVQCVVDPSFTYSLIPAYVLITNNTDSQVGYCTNIAALGASGMWTFGDTVSGEYTVIRATGAPGGILIYTPNGGSVWTHTIDFTVNNGGFTVFTNSGDVSPAPGNYVAATGWQATDTFEVAASRYLNAIYIEKNITATTITSAVVTYDQTNGTFTGVSTDRLGSSGGILADSATPPPAGTNITLSFSGSVTANRLYLLFHCGDSASPSPGGTITIKSIALQGSGVNPFGGGGAAKAGVGYSADYGATFPTLLAVGDSITSGGFDAQRSGSVSYAGYSGAVAKATTLGGAYSSWYSVPSAENATVIIIPYYRRNSSTKNTSVSDPDVVIGTDAGKWYWIDGTAATATTITPVANLIPINENSLTTLTGNRIAVIGSVSGAKRLYISTNGGSSWTLAQTMTAPTFIRVRRNDSRLSPNGQLFVMDSNAYYSSKFASAGVFVRNLPAVCTGLETIW